VDLGSTESDREPVEAAVSEQFDLVFDDEHTDPEWDAEALARSRRPR
jgi:hypothetical protein